MDWEKVARIYEVIISWARWGFYIGLFVLAIAIAIHDKRAKKFYFEREAEKKAKKAAKEEKKRRKEAQRWWLS